MMLQVLPRSHKDLALIDDNLGEISMARTHWNEALTTFQLAHQIKQTQLPFNHSYIAITLNHIGRYYQAIEDHSQALEYYTKASQYSNNEHSTAIGQLNLDMIHALNMNHSEALDLCLEARDTLHQLHPTPYPEIISCLCTMGHIYRTQKDWITAEQYDSAALELSRTTLFIGDPLRNNCVKALGAF